MLIIDQNVGTIAKNRHGSMHSIDRTDEMTGLTPTHRKNSQFNVHNSEINRPNLSEFQGYPAWSSFRGISKKTQVFSEGDVDKSKILRD